MNDQHNSATAPPSSMGRWSAIGVLSILLAAAAIGALWTWWTYYHPYESTDDAYVTGHVIPVSAVIPGSITAIHVHNTMHVEEGQLLLELDPTPYQLAYDQALASLSATGLQVRQLFDNLRAAQANVKAKQLQLDHALITYRNREGLVDSLAVSGEEFQSAKTQYELARIALADAEAQRDAAQGAVGNSTPEQHPRIQEARVAAKEAYRKLCRCRVFAPAAGSVAQRTVQVGQTIHPASTLLAILPRNKDCVWVEANFLETQLSRIQLGQRVDITIDMLSSQKILGRVIGIAAGTGSLFSIIPPQNATGNWVKVVQRVPVRIELEEVNPRICLGLSAKVSIAVEEPVADLPNSNPAIARAGGLEIDWEPVDRAIATRLESSLNVALHDEPKR